MHTHRTHEQHANGQTHTHPHKHVAIKVADTIQNRTEIEKLKKGISISIEHIIAIPI